MVWQISKILRFRRIFNGNCIKSVSNSKKELTILNLRNPTTSLNSQKIPWSLKEFKISMLQINSNLMGIISNIRQMDWWINKRYNYLQRHHKRDWYTRHLTTFLTVSMKTWLKLFVGKMRTSKGRIYLLR